MALRADLRDLSFVSAFDGLEFDACRAPGLECVKCGLLLREQ